MYRAGSILKKRGRQRLFPFLKTNSVINVLIMAISDGAEWALELLSQRYSRMLSALAYQMVTDYQIAEDLLQEVFFAVWRRAGSYAPRRGAVSNWLYSMMYHRIIDYLRTRYHRSSLKQTTWEGNEQDENMVIPDVWEEVWRSVQSAQVRAYVKKLPPEQCLVIDLVYFQGWTHKKIAETYHIPLGTVKSRLRYGLRQLKLAFEDKQNAYA